MTVPISCLVIDALAQLNTILSAHARELRSSRFVEKVESSIKPRAYATGSVVECYVDVELASGNAIAWWLEFQWLGDAWEFQASVLHNTEAGQESLIDLSTRLAVESEFATELIAAASELISTYTQIDLEAL